MQEQAFNTLTTDDMVHGWSQLQMGSEMRLSPYLAVWGDFSAMGLSTESANIGAMWERQKEFAIEIKKKENEAEQNRENAVIATALMQDIYQPEDYELHNFTVNGKTYQVSQAGIDATIDRIENDLDGMAEEYNLSDEQKQKLDDLKDRLKGKTWEEQQAIIQDFAKGNPDIVDAFLDNANKDSVELELSQEHKAEATQLNTPDTLVNNDDMGFDEFDSNPVISAEYNMVAQGEVVSITPELDNSGVQYVHIEPSIGMPT